MGNGQKKTTIVYAEDSKAISQLVKAHLKAEGFEVFHFDNGGGVVDAVFNLQPTVVLLDNDMPVKNGLSILEELKSKPETKEIPVIFFTTRQDQKSVVRCLELGVSDYIIKGPLSVSEIIPRIKKYIK
jgi:two-component system, OmpR family, phosphate regulon response regulator PhoB